MYFVEIFSNCECYSDDISMVGSGGGKTFYGKIFIATFRYKNFWQPLNIPSKYYRSQILQI